MRLSNKGEVAAALRLEEELRAKASGPHEAAGLLLSRLAVLLNLNRVQDCPAVFNELWKLVQHPDADPAQLAEFHSKSADAAYRQGSVEQCVSHLVRAAMALERAEGRPAFMAWLATATAYSYVGFHRQAVAALARARELGDACGGEEALRASQPEVRLRQAVFLDQEGDPATACGVFGEVAKLGRENVHFIEYPYWAYALARHRLLRCSGGEHSDVSGMGLEEIRALLHSGTDTIPENVELRRLGEAVLAILEQRPADALGLLADAHVTHTRLGAAEIPKLRTYAYRALGDYAAAYEAQAEVTTVLSRAANRMYDLFVDNVTVRLDYDELLRATTQFADEARTDMLTGLPNRRRLEVYVSELLESGGSGVIGVADVDRFKDVNTVHGHLVGDQVLQQIAAVLRRTARRNDFLARFAGDEFVIVFPETGMAEAQAIAERLARAVAAHGWTRFAPGTPVTLTIGLAELNAATSLAGAFRAADLLMLDAKRR